MFYEKSTYRNSDKIIFGRHAGFREQKQFNFLMVFFEKENTFHIVSSGIAEMILQFHLKFSVAKHS